MARPLGGPPRSRACGPTSCGPSDSHQALAAERYQGSPMVRYQGLVDRGRAALHAAGLRPYRVLLVWQERGFDRVWQTVRELELMPCKAIGMHELELAVTPTGVLPVGPVKLRQISPQQVGEDTLRGWLDGKPWASGDADRQWFYEILLHQRCEGDPEPRRRRFMIEGEPELKTETMEWVVRLTSAMPARDREGRDATVATEVIPGVQAARIRS